MINRKDFQAKYEIASKIQGWFSEEDMRSLHDLFIKFDRPIAVLEIGVWKGRSTIFSLLSLPKDSSLSAVDIFEDSNDHAMDFSICGKITGKDLYNIANETMMNNMILNRSVHHDIIWQDSHEYLERKKQSEDQYDLIFIDGDHRFKGFASDFIQCLDLIEPNNGIICGHDYGPSGPDVTKFLKMVGEDLFYTLYSNSSVWVLKQDKLEEAKRRCKKFKDVFVKNTK